MLFFKGTVDGKSKIYMWAPGFVPVLANHNRTDIVPGGDDAPSWSQKERRGDDSSVINGKLLFIAAGGGAYEIDASSPVPIGAGDALADVQGSGDRIVQHELAYYRVPFDSTVVDGIVYDEPFFDFLNHIRGIPHGYPVGGSPTGPYFPINRTGTELVLPCTLYGDLRFVANGVQYFWAYNPLTDLCTFMSTTPSHTAYPGYRVPFPALATSQTPFGTAGPAHPWRYDAASGPAPTGWGGLSPVRAIHTAKAFAYRDGELFASCSRQRSATTTSRGSRERAPTSLFVNGDSCGGVVDWQTGMVEANCQRLYRYTP